MLLGVRVLAPCVLDEREVIAARGLEAWLHDGLGELERFRLDGQRCIRISKAEERQPEVVLRGDHIAAHLERTCSLETFAKPNNRFLVLTDDERRVACVEKRAACSAPVTKLCERIASLLEKCAKGADVPANELDATGHTGDGGSA